MTLKTSVLAYGKFRLLRDKVGLNQGEVAERIGLSRPTYALVEQGDKELTVSQLYRLAELFQVDVDELVTGSVRPRTGLADYDKFKDVIMSCIRFGGDSQDGKITKTKLAKLVYLCDFGWYFFNKQPLTGMVYRRIQRGPVADEYFRAIDDLFEEQSIIIQPSGAALMISPNEVGPTSKLNLDETTFIQKVCEKWQGERTETIVNFTHNQFPWKNSAAGSFIPYEMILEEDPANVY